MWSNRHPPNPKQVLYSKEIALTWQKVKPVFGGLVNLGESCFMNASVQALMHLPGFVQFLEDDRGHRSGCYSLLNCVVCAVYRTYLNMSLHTTFRPVGLRNLLPRLNPLLKIGRQEDADEFLVALLDKITEELIQRGGGSLVLDFCSMQTTAVGQLFGWWSKTEDKCADCSLTKVKYAPHTNISLPLRTSVQASVNERLNKVEEVEDFTCLDKEEEVEGSRQCPSRLAYETVHFNSFPKVLRIVLNRYDSNHVKIDHPVTVEKSIYIRDAVYLFSSCILHDGPRANEGHYTCVATRPDGKLVYINDAEVYEAKGIHSLDAINFSSQVYILFYQFHHMKAQQVKRPLPLTPSNGPLMKKAQIQTSPVKKSLEKMGKKIIFSPKKFKRKVGSFMRSILPSKPKLFTGEDLAKPLHKEDSWLHKVASMQERTDGKELESAKTVKKLVIQRRRKLVPPSTSSQSLNEYELKTDEKAFVNTSEAIQNVPPIIIQRRRKPVPPSTSSQSLNEYKLRTDEKAFVNTSEAIKNVPPIIIQRRRKPVPPSTSSQSLNEYKLKTDEKLSESTVKIRTGPPLSPVSEGLHEQPQPQIEKEEDVFDSFCEYTQDVFRSVSNDMGASKDDGKFVYIETPQKFMLPHEKIEKNTVKDLQSWLTSRKVTPLPRYKKDLIALVKDSMNSETDTVGRLNVHDGKQQNLGHGRLVLTQDIAQLPEVDVFPLSGWEVFPSRDIPKNFNFGSVFNYIVETMPQLCSPVEHVLDSSDEDDEQVVELIINDPFEDAEQQEIKCSKKLRRGLQYVKSKYVRNLHDCLVGRLHCYKGQVRASMLKVAFNVKVAIIQVSGSIVKASCECAVNTLQRCSHISALLLHVLLHKHLNGPKAITCTSLPNQWNAGSLQREPGYSKTRQYASVKLNISRRSSYDPRPQVEMGTRTRHQNFMYLISQLSYKTEPCLFQQLGSLTYEDFTIAEEDLEILRTNVVNLYRAIEEQVNVLKPSSKFTGSFEVPGTKGQSEKDLWFRIRALNCSAQPSRRFDKFSTDDARMNFLRNHLWGLDKKTTVGMSYGKKHESTARKKYVEEQQLIDPTIVVEECGLYLSTEYIGLSCSPDGLIRSSNGQTKLLEIKVLYSLRMCDPNLFDMHLPKKKLSNFCLARNQDGEIQLKTNHSYYDQVQYSMGLLKLKECDFVVWTPVNMLTLHIPFDEERWLELKKSAQDFHEEYLAPEYFTMRSPRKLCPVRLQKR